MKVASVVGTRPQFVKAAALSPELRRRTEEILINTGQHYDVEMSDVFFDALKIPKPDYDLEIGSGSHGKQTGLMLAEIEAVMEKERPGVVLVYGDTNSTLAGALAAAKLNIPIGHVEAGLRSGNRSMPEEVNRVLVDHMSTLLFAPTERAIANLKREGIENGVHLVGDVMYDLAIRSLKKKGMKKIVADLGFKPRGYMLVTMHRPINTDREANLRNITEALEECGKRVIFPVHPRTAKMIAKFGLPFPRPGGRVLANKPVDYLAFLELLTEAEMVVTDSGGVQKEAYFFKVPCITLREETEWPETVEAGWNILVGADKKKIIRAIKRFNPKGKPKAVFGDGHAAEKIAKIVASLGK